MPSFALIGADARTDAEGLFAIAIGHAETAIGKQHGRGRIATDVAGDIADLRPSFAHIIAPPEFDAVVRFAFAKCGKQGTACRPHAAGHDGKVALRRFLADVALQFPSEPAIRGAGAEDAAFLVVRLLATTAKHEALARPERD